MNRYFLLGPLFYLSFTLVKNFNLLQFLHHSISTCISDFFFDIQPESLFVCLSFLFSLPPRLPLSLPLSLHMIFFSFFPPSNFLTFHLSSVPTSPPLFPIPSSTQLYFLTKENYINSCSEGLSIGQILHSDSKQKCVIAVHRNKQNTWQEDFSQNKDQPFKKSD